MVFHDSTEARDVANLASAADRERLLPGEPQGAVGGQDAEHWVDVYEDLVEFNVQMMGLIQLRLSSLPALHQGPEQADLQLLQAHLERLTWRLQAWKRVKSELMVEAFSA